MNSWLVTGGAGFIGSNFVRHALQHTAANLVVLDALTYAGNIANLAGVLDDSRVTFVHGDICDPDLVQGLFWKYGLDTVVHLAAESHVDRSILAPESFVRTNVQGTANLLTQAQRFWDGSAADCRFLHVSTDEVFGALGPDDPPFNESTPYAPSSPYSASKAGSDHLAMAWFRTFGLPVMISNCSNNYGPWQFPEKLIPLMILNAVEGKALPIYGDGMQVRDWLHVDDHCRALLAILASGTAGETYCVGGNNERANLDVVHLVCASVDAALGRAAGTSEALIERVADRPGHDRRYAIDASRLTRELGWSPEVDFGIALPQLVDWYLEHRDWAAAIRDGSYRDFYSAQYGGARLAGTAR